MERIDLVFGPPGCGKTTYLSRQIERAVRAYGPENVMVASFTRAAAAELAGRGLPLGKHQVGTLHSHCYRALGNPLIAERYLDDWNREHPQYRLTGESVDPDDPLVTEQRADGPGDEVYNRYQVLRARMVPRDLWPETVQAFARRWEAWKRETGTLDFTDLIEFALQDLEVAPGRPAVGFFDEAQDFTPLELALVRKWGENMDRVVLAGDDDQTIYAFKGATPDALLSLPVEDDQRHVLSKSYRVPRRVQAVAEAWIRQVRRRQPKEYRPREATGEVSFTRAGNWRKPEALVEQAMRYVEAGKTVMFLAACSYMLEPLKQVLKRQGIPFHNPYRRKRADWNPLYVPPTNRGEKKRYTSVERLLAFLRPDPDTWGEEAVRPWSGDDVILWAGPLKAEGVFLRGHKAEVDGWKGMAEAPLGRLSEIMEPDAFLAALDLDLDWYERHLQASKKPGMAFPIAVARRWGGKALLEEPRIVLGTVHSVKGGQADVVFLFPDLSRKGMLEWLGGAERRDAVVRQFYVGMTRCRETLVLVAPGGGMYVPLEKFLRYARAA